MLYSDNKSYILESFLDNFLRKNHNDFLAKHFRVEKTLKLLMPKYY